jgi:hypothetical protein
MNTERSNKNLKLFHFISYQHIFRVPYNLRSPRLFHSCLLKKKKKKTWARASTFDTCSIGLVKQNKMFETEKKKKKVTNLESWLLPNQKLSHGTIENSCQNHFNYKKIFMPISSHTSSIQYCRHCILC